MGSTADSQLQERPNISVSQVKCRISVVTVENNVKHSKCDATDDRVIAEAELPLSVG